MHSAVMRLQRVGIVPWDCRIWPLFLISNTLVALMPRMARIQAHFRLTSCPKNALLAQRQHGTRHRCPMIHETQVWLFPLLE